MPPSAARKKRAHDSSQPRAVLFRFRTPELLSVAAPTTMPGATSAAPSTGGVEALIGCPLLLGSGSEELARLHRLDATSIALKLEQLALAFQNGKARDDIALLVVKVPPRSRK